MCSIPQDAAATASRGSDTSLRVQVPPFLLGSIVALIVALLWRTVPSTAAFAATMSTLVAGVIGFLAVVVICVNYYISDLRKVSTSMSHISYLVKKVPPSKKMLDDLDKMTNPGGLTQLWKDEIQGNEKTFKILLTGVTGYVGRAFLFQLLREIAMAEEDGKTKLPHKVYVMARGKARKNLTAADRLQAIRDEAMFAPYKKQWDEVVLAAESGDLQDERCGMSEETVQMLADAQLTHVVHCAADVNFNRPLPASAGINISPALQLQALASGWPSCTRFVHCSTAFVNPGPGSKEKPMPEQIFPLGDYDPQELYDSMKGDQKLALKAKEEIGFPNNYVLTKCVAEHLVVRNNDSFKMELRICRPAVVGPAWLLPEDGWNGDKPSTISGVFLLWGTRVIRFAPVLRRPMPIVPVDVVAAGIIHAMIAPEAKKNDDGEYPVTFRNLIWSHLSPRPFMDGITLAKENVQAAMLLRHFSATEAALSFALLDAVARFPNLFDIIHSIVNLGPLYLLQFVCWAVRMTGIKTILDQVPVVKLFKFSDMLTLYKPYMGREYAFESSLDVPESLNLHRYSAGLLVATHGFWTKMFPGTIQDLFELNILPQGRLDLWWSLTQPCGSYKNRIIAYLACKILQASCTSVNLDLCSVEEVFNSMVKLEETMSTQKHCVVLASTYKSVIDVILIKYITIFMASMGVDNPKVLTKKEFDDPNLAEKLGRCKSNFDRHISLAALVKGSSSTDGVPKPVFGALEKIVSMEGDQDYTVIPLSLGYKSTCDSEILLNATKESSDIGLAGMLSLYWQVCVKKQSKSPALGDIRVNFGVPVTLDSKADLDAAAAGVHSEFQRLVSSSS